MQDSEFKSIGAIIKDGDLLVKSENLYKSLEILFNRVKDRKTRELLGGCDEHHTEDEL